MLERLDLGAFVVREREDAIDIGGLIDDLNADGGVVQAAATGPVTDTGMPGAVFFGHQVEDSLFLEARGLIRRVLQRRDQVMGTRRASGQRLDRCLEVQRRVMQHQETHPLVVGREGAVAVVVDWDHGLPLFETDGCTTLGRIWHLPAGRVD